MNRSYFKKLDDNYSFHLGSFYQHKALTVTPSIKINIKAISNVLVGIHLILQFQGKKFVLDESDESNEQNYLDEGDIYAGQNTIKGFIVNVIGKFLILSTAGMKTYEYEVLEQKLNHFRIQLMEKLLYIILNLHWREDEQEYRDTILLNALYFIYPENSIGKLVKNVSALSHNNFKSKNFIKNLSEFKSGFIPKYSSWINTYSNSETKSKLIKEVDPLLVGSIIFNKKIGFNVIHKIERSNNSISICFRRAGYSFDAEKNHFLWNNITFGRQCVAYD